MKHLKLISILIMTSGIFMVSCGSDPLSVTCSSEEFSQQVNDAGASLETALNEYVADPENSEKCSAFRSAGLKYVDELEDLLDCARTLNRDAEIQQAIDAYRAGYDDIEC